MKQYMVVEKFKEGEYESVYERFHDKGRMLPSGLHYLNSWVNKERNICYQLMETNNEKHFSIWIKNWEDLVDLEIVPID